MPEKPDKPQDERPSLLGGARGFSLRKILSDVPKDFVSNVGWQYSGTVAGSAISFIYALVVADALGASEFGLLAQGLAYAALVSCFVHLNLRTAAIRYIAKFTAEEDKQRTLAMTKLTLLLDVAAGAAALILIMGLSPFAKAFLIRDDRAILVIALAGCAYVFQNVADDTALALLRVFGRFRSLAITEIGAALLKLGGALAVVYWLRGDIIGILWVLVITHALLNIVRLLLGLVALRKYVPLRSHAPLTVLGPYRQEITRFLWYSYLRSISSFGMRNLDINVLGLFVSKSVIGVYKLAQSFFQVLYQLADAALLVVYPEIAKLWALGRFKELRRFIKSVILIMTPTGVAIYAAAFFAVPWVIDLFKPEYAEAGRLFRLMGWGIVIWSPFVWCGPLLFAANRPDLALIRSLVTGFTVLGLYFLLCRPLGADGAALVSAVTHGISVAIGLWLGRRAGIIFPKGKGDEDALDTEQT